MNDRPRSSKNPARLANNVQTGPTSTTHEKLQHNTSKDQIKTFERVKSVDTKAIAKHQNSVKQKKEVRPASSKGLRTSEKALQRSQQQLPTTVSNIQSSIEEASPVKDSQVLDKKLISHL